MATVKVHVLRHVDMYFVQMSNPIGPIAAAVSDPVFRSIPSKEEGTSKFLQSPV